MISRNLSRPSSILPFLRSSFSCRLQVEVIIPSFSLELQNLDTLIQINMFALSPPILFYSRGYPHEPAPLSLETEQTGNPIV